MTTWLGYDSIHQIVYLLCIVSDKYLGHCHTRNKRGSKCSQNLAAEVLEKEWRFPHARYIGGTTSALTEPLISKRNNLKWTFNPWIFKKTLAVLYRSNLTSGNSRNILWLNVYSEHSCMIQSAFQMGWYYSDAYKHIPISFIFSSFYFFRPGLQHIFWKKAV